MKRIALISLAVFLMAACGPLPADNSGTIVSGLASSGNPASTGTIASMSMSGSSMGSAGMTSSMSGSNGSTSTLASTSGASASGGLPAPYNAFPYLPTPSMSPGDVLEVTTSDICVSGYSSKVRNVPQSEKDQVYSEYGITSHAPGSYEIDHLISLELGGSNSIKNLWPQSYTGNWNAHIKDSLENKLHELVCSGSVDLKTAQHEIATNWIAAYLKYVGQP